MTLIVFWTFLQLQLAPALDLCHVEIQPARISARKSDTLGRQGRRRASGLEARATASGLP